MINVVQMEKDLSDLKALCNALAKAGEALTERVQSLETKLGAKADSFAAEAVEASENMAEVLDAPRKRGRPRKSES